LSAIVKYCKPILDRIIHRGKSLADAAKCALIPSTDDAVERVCRAADRLFNLPPQLAIEAVHDAAGEAIPVGAVRSFRLSTKTSRDPGWNF
jgi:hypothetical protein